MQVGIEAGVADSESCDCRVYSSTGGVGPVMVLGVRSDVPKSGVAHPVCQGCSPVSPAGCPEVG